MERRVARGHTAAVTALHTAAAGKEVGLYSHAFDVNVGAGGRFLFIGGQLSHDQSGSIIGVDDFDHQFHTVFSNLLAVLGEVEADFANAVTLRTYLTDASLCPRFTELRSELFEAELEAADAPPPHTLLVVAGLVKPEYMIEVDAVAFIPRCREKLGLGSGADDAAGNQLRT